MGTLVSICFDFSDSSEILHRRSNKSSVFCSPLLIFIIGILTTLVTLKTIVRNYQSVDSEGVNS